MKTRKTNYLHVFLETKNLNSLAAPELREKFKKLFDKYVCDFVVDCSSVEKIDSSGLNVFIRLSRLLKGNSYRLVLINANYDVKMIILRARMDEAVPFRLNLLDALDYLNEQNHSSEHGTTDQ